MAKKKKAEPKKAEPKASTTEYEVFRKSQSDELVTAFVSEGHVRTKARSRAELVLDRWISENGKDGESYVLMDRRTPVLKCITETTKKAVPA